ncbi:MAG: Ppx/GppA family phosphatase [Clostridia bacterium]|nr:Ppx/GppA family phosphatase [Clostridia bacterium]
MRVAIIDLGSNSIRMNVIDICDNNAVVLENIRRIVRLSEGMGEEKLIRQNAVDRTLAVLKDFKKIIDDMAVDEVRAIATAALRSAKNSELFTVPASEIGIEFEIISGEREAYYDYLGVVNTLPVSDCMIVDIGGASTELIYVKDGKNTEMVSIPMAAVNITEKYFSGTVADDKELDFAVEQFADRLREVDWLKNVSDVNIVGIGGTIRALAKMQNIADEEVHGFTMSKELTFDKIYELVKMPIEARASVDGIGNGRADIILGGVVPLLAIMDYINSPKLISCVSSLREGVMYDILKK